MRHGTIRIECDGPVATLLFSNPPDGYMDDGTEAALAVALDEVEGDAAIRAIVLTGADPGVFIRHFDVRVLEQRARKMAARGMRFAVERPVPETSLLASFRRIEDSPKPYLCALNGTAMGGGFELALCCDLRIAQDGPYDLGLPEVNLGLLPGAGGTQRLPRLVGTARALEIALLGRTVAPQEAARLGLVHECVADARARATALARALAAKPAAAIAHVKRLVRGALATPLEQGLAQERTLFCDLMVRPEAIDLMHEMNAGARDIRGPQKEAG
jgi:enoyl-CoA hydratase/carnithine racemase